MSRTEGLSVDILFAASNENFPTGTPGITCRKGDKWSKSKPGDVLNMMVAESRRVFGRAVVLKTEVVTHKVATTDESAKSNYMYVDSQQPGAELAKGLEQVYGPSDADDVFTLVTLLRLNDEE